MKRKRQTEILEEGRKAVEEDGAEVILLGAGMMVGYSEELQRKLGVTIVDPITCAVKTMEALIQTGYKTSKKNFFKPVMKNKFQGYSDILQP